MGTLRHIHEFQRLCVCVCVCVSACGFMRDVVEVYEGRKCFGTFKLRLYGVEHMVKGNSAIEQTHCRDYKTYSFRLAARVILCAPSHTHTMVFDNQSWNLGWNEK